MTYRERLETIKAARKIKGIQENKETREWIKSRKNRLKELQNREVELVKEAAQKLCPTLDRLNQVFYDGKGKITLTPLSSEKVQLGDPLRYMLDYSPYLDDRKDVRVEVQVDLYPPQTKEAVCTLNVWEQKKGWADLKLYFYGDDQGFKFFDFRRKKDLREIQSHIVSRVKENPYF